MSAYEELAAADAGAAAQVTAPGELPAEGKRPAEAPGAAPAEVRPARPRTTLAARLRGRQAGAGQGGRGRGKPKPRARPARPRVSVAGVVEWGWGILARAAQPVSVPLSRCLAMQAPVAGLVLEDVVRGTVVDRVLQPLARGQEQLQSVGALVLLPAAVAGLHAAEGLPEAAREVRRAFLIPVAREGAAMWVRVAGPKIRERLEQEAEKGPVYQQADELLVMLDMPFLTPADLGMDTAAQTAYGTPPEGGGPLSPEEARDMAAEAAQQFARS